LLLNDETFTEGVVAIRVSGVGLRMLVSQGCRPIGESLVITQAERNVIQSLGGKPALDVVFELFQTLPTQEQRMFQNGLHVGRVINEYQDSFGYGDFLIRNVVGIDKQQRSIAIGDYVRPGQTVQFHIRDSQSASIELQQMLKSATQVAPYQSALLFTCNGRGSNLFSEPHHDASQVCTNDKFPLAGFFAAGEIGPVGNKNFLHGFTVSVVLFD
jgi:small ligand-binding sensory domain FIST